MTQRHAAGCEMCANIACLISADDLIRSTWISNNSRPQTPAGLLLFYRITWNAGVDGASPVDADFPSINNLARDRNQETGREGWRERVREGSEGNWKLVNEKQLFGKIMTQ